jgi:superoxide reductase
MNIATRTLKTLALLTAAVTLSLAAATAGTCWAEDGGAENAYERMISPDFDSNKTAYDPKHTPKITAPDTVKRGEWFDVTIEIGQGDRHPSLVEHHVRWIALYNGEVELVRAYMHPVASTPKVTFTIRIEDDATLRALEEPTHTAAWESSKVVKVTD